MNRRLSLCLVALLGSGCLVQGLNAQTPGAPAVAPATTAPAPIEIPSFKPDRSVAPDAAALTTMQTWVTQVLDIVKTGQSSDQSRARDALVNEMRSPKDQNVSAAYIDGYARVLDDALVATLKSKQPLRTRLIIGVIAAKAAEKAAEAAIPLSDTAELLLQDSAEPIVLWGMKTAKFVLPGKLGLGQAAYKSLLDKIVPAATKHGGSVVEEAYLTLTLDPLNFGAKPQLVSDPANVAKIKVVLPHAQALFAKRVADWNAGTPKTPGADKWATLFLSTGGIWTHLSQQQKKEVIANTHELLSRAMAAWTVAVPKSPERDELTDLIKKAASALSVIGGSLPDKVLQGAAADLSKLTDGTPIPAAQGWMTSVTVAVKAMPMMQGSPASAAGGPTTQSSSAGVIGQAGLAK